MGLCPPKLSLRFSASTVIALLKLKAENEDFFISRFCPLSCMILLILKLYQQSFHSVHFHLFLADLYYVSLFNYKLRVPMFTLGKEIIITSLLVSSKF